MAQRIIDDNTEISYLDDTGLACFQDDVGNFTCIDTDGGHYRLMGQSIF